MAEPAPEAGSPTVPQETPKPIHSLVLDTGPLIKNDPSVDVLRARSEKLYILPSIIPEIRDAATRARVENTLLPFVTVRAPKPESIKFIINFARRTGDLEVLSRPDMEVLALTYELECERNGGDWRLRNTPGQKTLNGAAPGRGDQASKEAEEAEKPEEPTETPSTEKPTLEGMTVDVPSEKKLESGIQNLDLGTPTAQETASTTDTNVSQEGAWNDELAPGTNDTTDGEKTEEVVIVAEDDEDDAGEDQDDEDDDDGGGWITPSNLKKHKAKDGNASMAPGKQVSTLQAAILTSDFAMQNVALRMNLNLVSPSLTRISRLRTWVLRCHGCFKITRDMDRRFCPTCGQATLIRASCTVDDRTGALTVHLKKNFQWNNRGNVYSVPKPVSGSANGRVPKAKGKHSAGGKNGWGQGLILAEDQKEHIRAADNQRRSRKKDVLDEDSIPGILTGERRSSGGRIRVGAGRNVNSRKRR